MFKDFFKVRCFYGPLPHRWLKDLCGNVHKLFFMIFYNGCFFDIFFPPPPGENECKLTLIDGGELSVCNYLTVLPPTPHEGSAG